MSDNIRIMFKLKQLRTNKGLSQEALARLCDMSLTNVRKYEQGKMKSIPFDTLAVFCTKLDCQPGELFEKVEV
jgi:putative transcriptional regulator